MPCGHDGAVFRIRLLCKMLRAVVSLGLGYSRRLVAVGAEGSASVVGGRAIRSLKSVGFHTNGEGEQMSAGVQRALSRC